MSSAAARGPETRASQKKRVLDAHVGEVIPGLPEHLVVEHILTQKNLPDTLTLARLTVVSRAIRDAVAATGRRVEELNRLDAAKLGCFSSLQHWRRRDRLVHRHVTNFAAWGGHLDMLEWAHTNIRQCDEETCRAATENGQVGVLKWMYENGCKHDFAENMYELAANCGQLEVLQWLRANGCPWGYSTCRKAAEKGHLEQLKWARANGAPEYGRT